MNGVARYNRNSATGQAAPRLRYSHPGEQFYQRQIIRAAACGSGAVQRELDALTRAGILSRSVSGHQIYYRANEACPVFAELRRLVRKTFGVADVIREALAPVADRIRICFIFGSVAAGRERAGSDIDLMVVGDGLSIRQVVSALAGAQRELRREINPSVYSLDEFCRRLAQGDHFISHVVEEARVYLIGNDGDIGRLAGTRVAAASQDVP